MILHLASTAPAAPPQASAATPGRRVALHGDDAAMAADWQAALAAEGIGASSAPDAAADAIVLLLCGGLAPQLGRLRELRQGAPGVPLLVACRGLRDLDQVLALELGADDVLDAALSAPVVAARLRALWRRPARWDGEPAQPRCLQFGALCLALDCRRVTLDGNPVQLTEGEFEVLWLLASHAGRTLSRHEILKRVRGLDDQPLDRSIDSRIYRLRAKLGDRDRAAPRIRTVRHHGYLFSPADW